MLTQAPDLRAVRHRSYRQMTLAALTILWHTMPYDAVHGDPGRQLYAEMQRRKGFHPHIAKATGSHWAAQANCPWVLSCREHRFLVAWPDFDVAVHDMNDHLRAEHRVSL